MQNSISLNRIAKGLPLVRGLAHDVSPYHTGSVLENRLGLQVFRTIGKHLAWRLRPTTVRPAVARFVEVLRRDGVLVLPDFLAPQEFAAVRAEAERLRDELQFASFRQAGSGRLRVASRELSARGPDCPAIRKYLQGNELIRDLAAAAIRRRITSPPCVAFNVYRQVEAAAPDNDLENVLHADLHAPTIKAFFYLNEIDQANGAFVYAKGTHRLTLNRLRHEYDMSIRTAKLARGDGDIPAELIATRGPNRRNAIAPAALCKLKVEETHVCGRANTLVIADNMGFHRRGEFTGAAPRETILLNFRHLERCFW